MSTEQFYRFLYLVVWPFFNLFHPVRTVGREHIPEGAAVICPNHTALSDPFFVAFAFQKKNPLRVMAKIQLMRVPVIGWLLGKAGIFPEGTRVEEGENVDAKAGAAMFATRTGVPIVPMYIPAQKHWFRPTTVVIGEPYYPQIQGRRATAEENQEIAREIMRRIHALGGLPQ